ncbi:hypothetical protein [Kaarinaea lacus]
MKSNNLFALVLSGFTMGAVLSACSNDRGGQPKSYPDSNSPQALLYVDKCGQCHAAPLPSAHSANIWPSVLDRMQVRMKTKHVPPLTRQEMSIILGYLQQHAKQPAHQTSQPIEGSN